MTASIVLDIRRRTKKGYPIKIFMSNSGKKFIHLYEWAEKEHWSNGNVNKRHPEYNRVWSKLNKRGYRLAMEVEHCIEHGLGFEESAKTIENGLEVTELANLRKRLSEIQGTGMVFEFWDTFIKEKETEGRSTKAFREVKKQFENYTGDLPFTDINYEWLQGFVNFKYSKGCGNSGINYYLGTFRRIYFEAQRRESLGVPMGNPFHGLKKKVVKKKMVSLSRNGMKKLKKWVPDISTTEKNRYSVLRRLDIWLFQFYIGGHDLVDIALLKWKDIENGRVRFSRHKNRNKSIEIVDNVLLPEAMKVIVKYGTRGDERVFSFIPHPERLYSSYNHYRNNTNRALKKVSESIGSDILKTKSPRYIFRTWAGEARADIIATAQIQGHRLSGMTFTYQGRLPNEMVDSTLREVVYGKQKKGIDI